MASLVLAASAALFIASTLVAARELEEGAAGAAPNKNSNENKEAAAAASFAGSLLAQAKDDLARDASFATGKLGQGAFANRTKAAAANYAKELRTGRASPVAPS